MLEDDFLKEKQNIRQKMLKFSRAISQGKPLDDELKEEISSDDILRRRFKKKTKNDFLEDLEEEYKSKHIKKSNIYLKEDLINVKLEEKQSLVKNLLSKIKEKREKKKNLKKIVLFGQKKIKTTTQKKPSETKIKNQDSINQKENKEIIKPINKTHSTIKKPQSNKKTSISINQPDIKQSLENLQKKIIKQENEKGLSNPKIQEKSNNEDTQKVKNVLLEGFSNATKEDKNLNFNHLLFAALLVSFALFLFVPQIYIRNQIYYLSKEIALLRTEENVLNEENKELKRKLENMRFQNQILDYLE